MKPKFYCFLFFLSSFSIYTPIDCQENVGKQELKSYKVHNIQAVKGLGFRFLSCL
jgi:hypothetical protein